METFFNNQYGLYLITLKIPALTKSAPLFLVLLVLILAIPSYFVYDYTQNNPKFCLTCHLMNNAYDTWITSAMHETSCKSCHESDIATNLDHLRKALLLDPDEVQKTTEIDNERCEECHVSEDPQWLQVFETVGHQTHVYLNADEPDCITCHGVQLHIFEPPEQVCTECHDGEREIAIDKMEIHCLSCHEFTRPEYQALIPERSECLKCHESSLTMGVSFPSGAHSDTICGDCHNPHQEEKNVECTTCHRLSDTTLHNMEVHTIDCTSCHKPHSQVSMRDNCESCHTEKTEHYEPTRCAACH